MNDAMKAFAPASNWMTAGLVAAFVLSIGIIAEALRPGVTAAGLPPTEIVAAFSRADEKSSQRVLFRYR